MNLRSLLLTVVASATLTSVGAGRINHDKVQPFPQPEPVTVFEKAAVKFKPSLTIGGGCHPYPAVNAAGETSGGLKASGPFNGKCKGSGLGSQVYGRAAWHKDLCAIMYAWYFPKDPYYEVYGEKGHRHNWASVVVWLDNPALEKPKVLAVSAATTNGKYRIVKDGPPPCRRWSCDPPFADYFNDTSPMFKYGTGSSAVTTLVLTTERFGELQDLVMWEQMTEEARGALSETDFGEMAKVPFLDANFNSNLEASLPV
ncbi:hypothetical protein PF005_g20477 [Phytophthora fragariae]|uniref:Necrosis inducing protein NPP1 type n=1 Tax=Phytophthora fragariae TaxID=53985 RepID=A0A6A3R172_9STRA|nr:hypothetical protein PF003_g5914 [Phytophthora fragariae]KAE8928706.1 hypothetical protein PF009_g21163 [Phytophthora fragariae]KAE8988080.1 hypothetical protein PF011_g19309 [Phytophthora fragariae]KAE9086997.1 hypothetical protein PF007_g20546 [Phytophthora fragariae]KAE9115006.1 hypothetical protein PF006_g19377 [Phytophthora fragariae]